MVYSYWTHERHASLVWLAETGATYAGAAAALGVSEAAIRGRCARTGVRLQPVKRSPGGGYNWHAHTIRSMHWFYPDRAAQIIAGKDPATQADLHRWRNLGSRGAAA